MVWLRWEHDGIAVLGAHHGDLDEVRPRAWSLLSPAERRRAETLQDAAADDLVLGRYLLRTLAGTTTAGAGTTTAGAGTTTAGTPDPTGPAALTVTVTATCPACGAEHARPRLPGLPLHASIAHAGGFVVAAVAPAARIRSLGIDTEPVPPDRDHRGRPVDLRAWTLTEAVGKAEGTGIVPPPEPDLVARYRRWEVPAPGHVTTVAWLRTGETVRRPPG